MGIKFSKSLKIGKLLKLNFSKSGVSATIGKKGASINVSKNGVYANASPSAVGVNGTGVSYRQKIVGFKNEKQKKEKEEDLKNEIKETNPNIDEAIEALKELGYKEKEIKEIEQQLYELEYDNSTDYLKEALKMLKK